MWHSTQIYMQTPQEKNIEHVINISGEVTQVDQVENPVGQADPLDLLSRVFWLIKILEMQLLLSSFLKTYKTH